MIEEKASEIRNLWHVHDRRGRLVTHTNFTGNLQTVGNCGHLIYATGLENYQGGKDSPNTLWAMAPQRMLVPIISTDINHLKELEHYGERYCKGDGCCGKTSSINLFKPNPVPAFHEPMRDDEIYRSYPAILTMESRCWTMNPSGCNPYTPLVRESVWLTLSW